MVTVVTPIVRSRTEASGLCRRLFRSPVLIQPHRFAFSTCAQLTTAQEPQILLQDKESGFEFIHANPRTPKPRENSVTEIRGPSYSVMGKRYLPDALETMGYHVDDLKFAGGSFTLFPEKELRELIDLAHSHEVYVSTSEFMEHLLTHPEVFTVIDRYLQKCKDVGFDVIELLSDFLSFPLED
jgi:(2R)-phospho-3-sulfolactate synthase (ComA)